MAQSILAIDDEPDMLRLLERIVREKTGYRIVTTNNPLEAPRLLDGEVFDLIVADLKMPGMDGLDILRMLKEKGRPEEMIIITAFGSLETAMEALSLGVFDYITKPFKKEQIIFAMDRAMRWVELKRESAGLGAIFGKEPFAEALGDLQREYVRRLARRAGPDEEALARRSGLSAEIVAAAMNRPAK
ncbi:MAG: response regulator [Elusimicrobia bacterium]|nr:response regulator [Elusimicrobiota bacterium]